MRREKNETFSVQNYSPKLRKKTNKIMSQRIDVKAR